jgi:uncharacterized protein (DUF934 family)
MPLVKNGEVVTDRYTRLDDDAATPAEGAVLISAARFLADPALFASRADDVGVVWPNNRDIAELAPYLKNIALVALVFPTFKDGRAYSQARILREQLKFPGELRATGQVLRDQFVFMQRSGFDSFDVKKDSDAKVFASVVKRYTVFYQPTGDGRVTALHERLFRHSSAPVSNGDVTS